MPTIQFAFKDFQNMLGKKLSIEEFEELALEYAKAEVEGYDKKTDHVKLSLDDTNLPYLWSVEGLARYFEGILEKKKGFAAFKSVKSNYVINVDKKVKDVRPAIATFVAEKGKIDDYLLEQLIQLQEKYCDGYGRRRQKVSIGLYSHKRIEWPVTYTTANPDSLKFQPLEMSKDVTLREAVAQHPKGKLYGWILKDMKEWPLLVDSKKQILSLIPIVNSNFTGKVEVGDTELLFEATGTDFDAVNLAANIFAQNLYERGFTIKQITINDTKKIVTPHDFKETIKINEKDIAKRIGLDLSSSAIKKLLERARYHVVGNTVHIPHYRRDILHWVDIMEDVAIMQGFQNIESGEITSYTTGASTKLGPFVDVAREIAVGLGHQEILSPVLTNRDALEGKMGIKESGAIEIENIMSETYSAVRTWIIPNLLDVFSQNKHRDYPQKIFEEGVVTNKELKDRHVLAMGISHSEADFTDIKQAADSFFKGIGVDYSIQEREHGSFIQGRVGNLIVSGKQLGIIGEVHPTVLTSWNLEMPVCVLEVDVSALADYCQNTNKK